MLLMSRAATGQEIVREKTLFMVREKSWNFILSQGKLKHFEEKSGKIGLIIL